MTMPRPAADIRVLLPKDGLFVAELLRRFALFRSAYDQSHLEAAAGAIGARLGDDAVDRFMSDLLLMDNELRLRTHGTFTVMAPGSPWASDDEFTVLGMIAAMQAANYRAAASAAVRLEIVQARMLLMLANRLAAHLGDRGIRLDQGVLAPLHALNLQGLDRAARPAFGSVATGAARAAEAQAVPAPAAGRQGSPPSTRQRSAPRLRLVRSH